MIEKIYTVKEAAELLKLKPKTIRRYCREGLIPALKFGSHYRITEETIKEIVNGERELVK